MKHMLTQPFMQAQCHGRSVLIAPASHTHTHTHTHTDRHTEIDRHLHKHRQTHTHTHTHKQTHATWSSNRFCNVAAESNNRSCRWQCGSSEQQKMTCARAYATCMVACHTQAFRSFSSEPSRLPTRCCTAVHTACRSLPGTSLHVTTASVNISNTTQH